MDFSFLPSHHALCIVSLTRDDTVTQLRDHFGTIDTIVEVIDNKVIDIETARYVKSWNVKSFEKPKVMILSFHTIGMPAQNALLKVLEEPYPDTRFILVTSHLDGLLPTVRSRLSLFEVESETAENSLVSLFLKTAPALRLELDDVQLLLNAKDENDRKDREGVQLFISNVLEVLVKSKSDSLICKEVADCALYASDPSSSSKMLLEYISLRVPRIVI